MHLISSAECQQLGDEIHVWHATLDRDKGILVQLESTLSPDEKARADRFHFLKDRNHYIVARGLLRELLGVYLQQSPAGLEFSYTQYGKPFLSGANASGGLNFNLAHSAGLVVYAVARERNLGIDVELIKAESAGEEIAKRYFSAREVNELRMLPPEEKIEGFFLCWTRKEAYLKATGMGLQIPLDSFAINLGPSQPAQFLGGVEPRWKIASYRPAKGYAAALVYDGAPSSIKYFPVNPSVK